MSPLLRGSCCRRGHGGWRFLGGALGAGGTGSCSVILNIGTTTEEVARALVGHRDLLVITNNLNVANILATSPNSEVIVAGGILRRADGALVGDVTAEIGSWML